MADNGDLRLACHLVEMAALADPTDAEVHRARSEVYLPKGRPLFLE